MKENQQSPTVIRLSDLAMGDTAEILYIDDGSFSKALGERLRDYGICEGEILTCAYTGLLGDPVAYCIDKSHTVLAIRRSEANMIRVRVIGATEGQRRRKRGDKSEG